VNAMCANTIGSFNCTCKIGYIGDGIICSCLENEYPFNETTCFPCPENSISTEGSISIFDCKCTGFNHYLDNQTSTCLPCDLGFKVDKVLNICQSNFPFFLFFFLNYFLKIKNKN